MEQGDLRAALRQLTEASTCALNVERASIWLFNDAQTELSCLESYDRETRRHGACGVLYNKDAPHYFEALREARTLTACDVQRDEKTRELSDYLAVHGIRALLDAPIVLEGRLVGVVCHEHVGAPRKFQAWEELLAGTFADFAAMALAAENRVRQAQSLRDMQRELTAQREREAHWRRLATTDALTGTYNRRKLLELGEAELRRVHAEKGSLSVAMLDVDHFKRVNDAYGHRAGDRALRAIARTVRRSVRQNDHVARYGGEELVVLLPDTCVRAAKMVVERIRAEVSNARIEFDGQPVSLTLSAGVVSCCGEEKDFLDLLQRADEALYLAKQRGRNCVVAGS